MLISLSFPALLVLALALSSVTAISCCERCNATFEKTFSHSGLVWVRVGLIEDDNGTVAVSEYCPLDYCDDRGDPQ